MKARASNAPKVKKPRLKVVLDREQRIVLDEIAHAMSYPYRDAVDDPWTRRRPHWTDNLKAAA